MRNNAYYIGKGKNAELTQKGYDELKEIFYAWSFIVTVNNNRKPLSRGIKPNKVVIEDLKKKLQAKLPQEMQSSDYPQFIASLAKSFIKKENESLAPGQKIQREIKRVLDSLRSLAQQEQVTHLRRIISQQSDQDRHAYRIAVNRLRTATTLPPDDAYVLMLWGLLDQDIPAVPARRRRSSQTGSRSRSRSRSR